jgi:Pectate lyase superfamily protein
MFNVKDFRESGDDGDSPSIQRAIDACAAQGGGDVFFPTGIYSVKNAGSNAFCIKLASKVRLVGESRAGSIVKQSDNLGLSVRLVQIESNDCGLSNITLDGNKAKQSVDEQRHGIFVVGANRLLVENVTSQNFTGDGFYIGSNVSQVTFSNVLATLNGRSGIALAQVGKISDVIITNSIFIGNAAQQIDSEPKIPLDAQKRPIEDSQAQVNNVTISGCIIDPGSSNNYAVTCSGGGRKDKDRSHGWTLTGNIIKGSVLVVWCDDVCITGNVIDNPTTLPCVEIKRTAKNITVTGNRLKLSQTENTKALKAVDVFGKRECINNCTETVFDVPRLVSITNNIISVTNPLNLAVRAQGVESVSIMGNQIDGGGIQVRATAFGSKVFRSAIVAGNTIANARGYAIGCEGDKQNFDLSKKCPEPGTKCADDKRLIATGLFHIVDISHNVIDDNIVDDPDPTGSLKQGIFFDNKNLFDGQELNADIQITMIGNHIYSSKAPLTNFPSVPYLTGGNRGAGAVFGTRS